MNTSTNDNRKSSNTTKKEKKSHIAILKYIIIFVTFIIIFIVAFVLVNNKKVNNDLPNENLTGAEENNNEVILDTEDTVDITYERNNIGLFKGNNIIEEKYDMQGNLIYYKAIGNGGKIVEKSYNYAYDSKGNIIKVSDSLNNTLELEYGNNHILKVISYSGEKSEYKYNKNGQIENITVYTALDEKEYSFSYYSENNVNYVRKDIIDTDTFTGKKKTIGYEIYKVSDFIQPTNVFELLNIVPWEYSKGSYSLFGVETINDKISSTNIINFKCIQESVDLISNNTRKKYFSKDGYVLKDNGSVFGSFNYKYDKENNKIVQYELCASETLQGKTYTETRIKYYLENGVVAKKVVFPMITLTEEEYNRKLEEYQLYYDNNIN